MIKSFESIWDNCLAVIKDNVSIQAFKTWFEPIKPVKLKSRRHKKKKQKVKEEASPEPELPDITKTHADTNFNEYGDYSIEKFIPDKKEDEKEDE